MAKKKKGEEQPPPAAEGGEGQEKKKGLPIKLIIIALGGLLVLGGGGFAAWKFFLAPKPKVEAEGKKEPEAKPVDKPGTMMPLEPFVVNLVDPAGKRFLKLTLAVDIKEEKTKKEIESRLPQIRDAILLLLTSKGYNDIAQVAGKLRLRNDILRIINQALGASGQVHAVYFTEFVIQ
jgi:flagellar FliL protein